MRKVQVYIEGQRLELFKDEVVQIISSVQNVNDIAKVFTDFSQSFTIPASEHNNAIFKHFYENAIDSSLDHQVRRAASIEIDFILFRTGKIQIEKSNIKNGRVESYTITFFGDIRTLQDFFGEDKLNTLDMSPFTHFYSGAEVQDRIEDALTDFDIRYPLISSKRAWTYGDNANTDISQNSHKIVFTELFPAIKVEKIFEAIETKYGINFTGLFLNDSRFKKLFLWLKNKDSFAFYDRRPLDFTAYNVVGFPYMNEFVNLADNEIQIVYQAESILGTLLSVGFTYYVKIYVTAFANSGTNLATNVTYLDIYKNGTLLTTRQATFNNVAEYAILVPYDTSADSTFTFKGRTTEDVNVEYYCEMTLIVNGSDTDANGNYYCNTVIDIADNLFTKDLDIAGNMPDMKIKDFVSGIIKQFNLTCVASDPTTFALTPLETWYAQGRLFDVTKYIDIESIDIERVKLFKKIDFKHQKSETLLNTAFSEANFREYGDLQDVYDYDGGEYTIELPFETILHQRFTGEDLQVGYSLDKTLKPIIPKPVLLYFNGEQDCSFYLNNGTTTDHILTYAMFGQDLVYNGSNYTLNFGWDNSSFYLEPIQNNIFLVYYYNYLGNLYSKKQRLTYCKGIFPTAILTSLKLNDRLIIRDKRYIINEIKTNANTGDVDLVLLHDFRQFQTFPLPIFVAKGQGVIEVPFYFKNSTTQVDIDLGTTGITTPSTTLTEPSIVEFTLPSLTPFDEFTTENPSTFITETGFQTLRLEEGNDVTYEIDVTYRFEDGSTETETLIITQER